MKDAMCKIDGVWMSETAMYNMAVRLYGKFEFIITNSKAALVLRLNGHNVERFF